MTIFMIVVVILLILLISRSGKRRKGLKTIWDRKCPYCRERINSSASVCPECGSSIEPARWIWQRRDR